MTYPMSACSKALTEGALAMGRLLVITCSGNGQPSNLWQWVVLDWNAKGEPEVQGNFGCKINVWKAAEGKENEKVANGYVMVGVVEDNVELSGECRGKGVDRFHRISEVAGCYPVAVNTLPQ